MSRIDNITFVEKTLKRLAAFLLKKLNTYHNNLSKKSDSSESNYKFLTPNDQADNIVEYSRALKEALENKKVRNIAVSGSYGSGKSSFIKTFEKNHKNSTYEFLDISLARFSQKKAIEPNSKDNKSDKSNSEVDESSSLSLIEKSILEQMFYRVKSSKIPQSRLRKINKIKSPISMTAIILFSLFSFFVVFKPELISNIVLLDYFLQSYQSKYLKYIPIIVLLLTISLLTYKIIHLLSGISIGKLNLKDLELVSNDKDNESLLNKHLDEILYFFEQTKFNVVVFQDLDRFKNLEIFTKLRELNSFINNSEQIGRNVKFIYAVRDDIFSDSHERTKFFDFVIPIIPYINASSSEEKLLEFFNNKENKTYEIDRSFLYGISLYIADMRLLKNIYNEYKIYRSSLDRQLDKTKLLAIIVYKNFYPLDFEKLHKYNGLVYNVFSKRSQYAKTAINSLMDKIINIEEQIEKADDTKNELLEQIRELQDEINEIDNYSIQKIIKKYAYIDIFGEEFEDKDLLKYLISYGYIDKDYNLYISNFFGTSITRAENNFLLNIKNNGKHLDFNYELINLEELLREERLGIEEYKKEAVLNFNLVDYILINKNSYLKQYVQLFKQLANQKEASARFIFDYLDRQKNLKSFTHAVARYYHLIWQYTTNNKTDEEKSKYFYMFLEHLDAEQLKNLDIDNSLAEYISSLGEINYSSEEIYIKLENLIRDLNIKFKLFKSSKKQTDLFEFIYDNNYYELNREMIDYIIFVKSGERSDIYENLNIAHYTTILNSEAEKLKLYVDENLDEYINRINLMIDTNTYESENTILKLLNDEKLKQETKIKIIKHQKTKISDIASVDDRELWYQLLEENKLISSWENVSKYYNYVEALDESLIGYLNNTDNSKPLFDITIDDDYIKNYPDFNTQLLTDLIECNDFELVPYSNLVRENDYSFKSLNLSKLDDEKINILIDDKVLELNNANFELLKKNSEDQHILFLEKNIDEFIDEYNSFNIDSDDIARLLETKIVPANKRKLTDLVDYSLINTPRIAKLIYSNIDKNEIRSYEYIENMVSNLESTESKVNLIIEQQSGLSDDELIPLLQLLPDEYSKIANLDGKQTLLPNRDYNKNLIELLSLRGFITSHKPDKKDQTRLYIKDKARGG